jgi:hypothetical protein
LTVIAGTGEDSVFGYGFLPGILALVIWSMATSIASYRALATTARGLIRDVVSSVPERRAAGQVIHSQDARASPSTCAGLR